jgi:hypothetical protein
LSFRLLYVEVEQLLAALKAEHAAELVTFVALPGIQASTFGVGETKTTGVHVGSGVDGTIGVDEAVRVGKAVGVGEAGMGEAVEIGELVRVYDAAGVCEAVEVGGINTPSTTV